MAYNIYTHDFALVASFCTHCLYERCALCVNEAIERSHRNIVKQAFGALFEPQHVAVIFTSIFLKRSFNLYFNARNVSFWLYI